MIGRITHQTVQQQTLANLQRNLSAMSALQSQMSSGKRVNVASDDPAVAGDVLRLQGEQRALGRYERSIADGNSWLTTVDSALSATLAALREARDLVVQGGNGGLGQTSRDALATNLEGVRDTLLDQANTSYLGRQVFAGTSAQPAFTVGTDAAGNATYTFTGTADAVTREVAPGRTVRVDADGAAVYGVGDDSVFKLIDDIVATLRAGGDPTSQDLGHLDALDARIDAVLTQVAGVGARHAQVLDAKEANADAKVANKTRLSSVQDVDLAETLLDLQTQEVAYKGALGAAAKVLQPTLLDFLR
jgi:flagellar hook-associated protein 3 FlgL